MLVLAVDGGGGGTRALLGTSAGEILGYGAAGPSDHFYDEAGRQRLQEALAEAARGALGRAGVAATEIAAGWLGLNGVPEGGPEADAAVGLLREVLPCPCVGAGSDLRSVLAGATLGRPGVVVYAGTGSAAYGQDAAGRLAQAGGWGSLIDDEGGAYQLGRAALRAVFRAADGRAPATALDAALLEHFGVRDLPALRRAVYGESEAGRYVLAGLARRVGDTAAAGDAVARTLLAAAGMELAGLAVATARKLPGLAPATLFTAGGVFRAGELLLKPFRSRVRQALPNAGVRPAAATPLVGSFLLALKLAGVELSNDVVETLRRSYPEGFVPAQAAPDADQAKAGLRGSLT